MVFADDGSQVEADGAPGPEFDAEPVGDTPGAGLDARSLAILAFERGWWRHAGAKDQAIRDTFGLSPIRYYQLLNALLDQPAAAEADPVLVGRLRRIRAGRARR